MTSKISPCWRWMLNYAAKLPDDWDGFGSKAIAQSIVDDATPILDALELKGEIQYLLPTTDETILMKAKVGEYLLTIEVDKETIGLALESHGDMTFHDHIKDSLLDFITKLP